MSYIDELFKSGVWGTKEPKEPEWVKWIHRNLSENHCPECLKLDGCYFLKEKAPKHPHHPYCHCLLNSISYNTVLKNAKAKSSINKYVGYLFSSKYFEKNGKDGLFMDWGFSVEDSEYLLHENEKQALEKYVNGDYKLGKLDEYGQRISIKCEISRKDTGETILYMTGWMVYPNGEIRLNTPYGGK